MSSEPGSVTCTAKTVEEPAVASWAPFHVVPAACRVAVGATLFQRAVKVTERVALATSLAVTVTGRAMSSPRVAVHDQVPAPLVRVPVDVVSVTASPSESPQVPWIVSALPSRPAAGVPVTATVGAWLAASAAVTSIRRVLTVTPPDGYETRFPLALRSAMSEAIDRAGECYRISARVPTAWGVAIDVPL